VFHPENELFAVHQYLELHHRFPGSGEARSEATEKRIIQIILSISLKGGKLDEKGMHYLYVTCVHFMDVNQHVKVRFSPVVHHKTKAVTSDVRLFAAL